MVSFKGNILANSYNAGLFLLNDLELHLKIDRFESLTKEKID